MYSQGTRQKIEAEFSSARAAREQGMEGRARVCARRAAGIAARAYLQQRGLSATGNAYEMLQSLQAMEELPESARRAAHLLTLRVDEDYHLPVEADLLIEAQTLVQILESPDSAGQDRPQNG